MAYYTINPTGLKSVGGAPSIPATRRTFVQWILDDQTVPNPTTLQLVQAALHNPTANAIKLPSSGPFWSYQFNSSSVPYSFNATDPTNAATYIPPCNRHPFLLAPPGNTCGGAPGAAGLTLTGDAQLQLVGFLTGAAPY